MAARKLNDIWYSSPRPPTNPPSPIIPRAPAFLKSSRDLCQYKEYIGIKVGKSLYGANPVTGMAAISKFFTTFSKLTETCFIDSYNIKRQQTSWNPIAAGGRTIQYDVQIVLRYKHEPRHLKAKNVPEEV